MSCFIPHSQNFIILISIHSKQSPRMEFPSMAMAVLVAANSSFMEISTSMDVAETVCMDFCFAADREDVFLVVLGLV